jgi:hypothetical protein
MAWLQERIYMAYRYTRIYTQKIPQHVWQSRSFAPLLCLKYSKRHKCITILFHWHVQIATIPCRSQELLPFLVLTYFFLPLFSTLLHFIFPSISWSTSWSCCYKFIYNNLLGILFSSIVCTCPNQHNLYNLIISVTVGFLTIA